MQASSNGNGNAAVAGECCFRACVNDYVVVCSIAFFFMCVQASSNGNGNGNAAVAENAVFARV